MSEIESGLEKQAAEERNEWARRVTAKMEKSQSPIWWADFSFGVDRIFIRTFRILAGVVLGFGATLLISLAGESLGKPFASLSPLELIGGICAGIVGFLAICVAFVIAFGKGQSRAEATTVAEEQRRRTAENRIRQSDRDYELGRFAGRLFRKRGK